MTGNPFQAITPEQVLAMVQSKATQAATALSQEEAARTAVMALLAQVSGKTIGEKDLVFEGQRFVLPQQYEGKLPEAISFLERFQEQQSKTHEYVKTFNYRPYDVAHALTLALTEVFGNAGMGESWTDMFGDEHHPQFVEVPTGVGQSVQVPWDWTALPILHHQAKVHIGATRDRDLGMLGKLTLQAPRSVKAHVEADMLRVIDYGKVYEAFKEFTPAFAKEAISRAKRYAIARQGGMPDFLTTNDFVGAANSLNPQLELMHAAEEEKTTPTTDKALRELFADVLDAVKPVDADGDKAEIYGQDENVDGFKVDRDALPA